MNYLILIAGLTCHTLQSAAIKKFNNKTENDSVSALFFNLCSCAFAFIFFVAKSFITAGRIEMHIPTLIYSVFLGATYVGATVFYIYTVKYGPLALSALVLAYSLVIPTMYGIVFLKEPVGVYTIIGFALLVISIWLINREKSEVKITFKWVIFAALTFVVNGLCATLEKAHQVAFPEMYQNELMTYTTAVAVVGSFIYLLFATKCKFPKDIKPAITYGSMNGCLNAAYNATSIFLAPRMAASLLYPLQSAGDIVFTFALSFFIFKERFEKLQYVGLALGIGAIVFLNL